MDHLVTHSATGRGQGAPAVHRPTFSITCWVLALIGFSQLLAVGTALAVRDVRSLAKDESALMLRQVAAEPVLINDDEPLQVRSLEQILQDAELASGGSGGAAVILPEHAPVRVQPTGVAVDDILDEADLALELAHRKGEIANPRVERLVGESRRLHLEGDMMRAMLKLDEASRLAPFECAVIYEKGLLYEDMGIYTKAADQYQQIQQMGLLKAGTYFRLAASKLTKGMDTASARRSTIAIGPMKVNRGSGANAGRSVDVAVTLLGRPDQPVSADDVEVQVYFYDKVNGGEIKKAAANARIEPTWSDGKVDWQDVGNEETLRVSYSIPRAAFADEHLLGRREFYGFIVELIYKGEVIDQQAYPRRLHSIHGESLAPSYPDEMPWLPGDADSLLPGKGQGYGYENTLPSR